MYIQSFILLTTNTIFVCSSFSISNDEVIYIHSVKYVQGYRLNSGIFRIFTLSSYFHCVRECLYRQQCVTITYHWKHNYCHLGFEPESLEKVSDNDSYTSYPTDWSPPQSLAGNCASHGCEIGQRCTELHSGRTECIDTECPDPPAVTSTNISSSLRAVGDTVLYISTSGYSITGNTSITCLANLSWTSPDFVVNSACPDDYQTVNVYCIKLVDDLMSYDDGISYCASDGGRLIEMRSQEKFDDVIAVIQTGRYFLAGMDEEVEGTWKFPNGDVIPWDLYTRSRNNQLDTDNEDCLTYDHAIGYQILRDLDCFNDLRVICEIV